MRELAVSDKDYGTPVKIHSQDGVISTDDVLPSLIIYAEETIVEKCELHKMNVSSTLI